MEQEYREFRYLDGDAERRWLVREMRSARQLAVQIAHSIPEERHHEPRYHGWSLAAMLAHLHTVDAFALWQIRLALMSIRFPIALQTLNSLNDSMAIIYRRRIIDTTLKGIEKNADNIADFIMNVPMKRFSKLVYHPPTQQYLTVEKAMQQYFVFHWQDHLDTIQSVEGMSYEPPKRSTED